MPLDENARCTVCIPTYNQAEYLKLAVESVAAQTAPVRLLVSDDASSDNTAEVIATLQRQHRFQAKTHETNLGISANLQWLLRQPQTTFIMRLDSDDLLHPEYVRKLTELLDCYPEAGYAHCAIQEIDGEGRNLSQRRLGRVEAYQSAETTLKRLVYGLQVTANVLLFRREALASVDFGAGSAKVNFVEDYDMGIRLADAGWGDVYDKEILASYRMWAAASRSPATRKLTEVRGLHQVFSSSLLEAFSKRQWSLTPLKRRRVALALANSDILDRAAFPSGEREAMERALLELGDTPAIRWVFGNSAFSRTVRRSMQAVDAAKLSAKRGIKQLFFR